MRFFSTAENEHESGNQQKYGDPKKVRNTRHAARPIAESRVGIKCPFAGYCLGKGVIYLWQGFPHHQTKRLSAYVLKTPSWGLKWCCKKHRDNIDSTTLIWPIQFWWWLWCFSVGTTVLPLNAAESPLIVLGLRMLTPNLEKLNSRSCVAFLWNWMVCVQAGIPNLPIWFPKTFLRVFRNH